MEKPATKRKKITTGWVEWCSLPELGLPAVRAKLDTGAKSSALYAFDIKPFTRAGNEYVRFRIHPLQKNRRIVATCVARVYDSRIITSSNGHKEERYIIRTVMELGGIAREIDISLSKRDSMAYRMLLGREALAGAFRIDPGRRQKLTRLLPREAVALYANVQK